MRTWILDADEYRNDAEFKTKISLEIVAIMNLLLSSNINYFEFICDHEWCFEKKGKIIMDLREMLTNFEMIDTERDLVIKSKKL